MAKYYYCPTTGKIEMTGSNDKKLLCSCGQTNPIVTEMGGREVKNGTEDSDFPKGMTLHLVDYLIPAPKEAYLVQVIRDTTPKENNKL
tara:strand:- start:433 stop:696 length:264 start_codon:yes stop_codon:yes gene_type:complete